MYCFSGIWFRIVACGAFFLLGGIVFLLLSKFWNASLIIKKHFFKGLIITLFAVGYILYHVFLLVSPSISYATGRLVESRRDSRVAPPWPVTWAYVFDTGDDVKQRYYIDSFSKHKIFPTEVLNSNSVYRVYYEERTKIILKIEECELQ